MKRTIILALAHFTLLWSPGTLLSQGPTERPSVPAFINYQGYVTDSNGVPLGDATPTNFDVTFRIYTESTGGGALWGERQTVTFTGGQFSVLLGNGIAINQSTPTGADLLADLFAPNGAGTSGDAVDQLFLGIAVNDIGESTAAEVVPRQQLVANPFAFRARTADVAEFAHTVADGAISASALAAGSITGGTGGAVADGSITSADLAANTVTSDNIAAGAVTNAEIADNAVTNAKMADNAVGSAEIVDGSITTADLANNAVNSAKIADNSITANDLAANSVRSSEIAPDHISLRVMTHDALHSKADFFNTQGLVLNRTAVFAGQWNGSFYALQGGGSGAPLVHTSQGQVVRGTSSRRYKENIRPLAENFRKILKAEPRMYNRPGNPDEKEIGFIAEEFDELGLDYLVIRDLEGRPDALAYDKISIYLLQLAKDQQAVIEAREARMDALEALAAKLQVRLEKLEQNLTAGP